MRAPLSWLRDYAPLDATASELAERLSSLGLVVEGVEEVGGGLDDVVVARVLDVRNHPNAERIRLVDVDTGDGETQIVCGAWNFQVGDLVPLAPVGAVLPGGFEISRRKMRGEWSNGMLCSADELRLPSPAGPDGLLVLPAGLAAPGVPLVEALDLQPDVVFDLDISANRPDALCMAGVARDLAAALGEPWSMPADVPHAGGAPGRRRPRDGDRRGRCRRPLPPVHGHHPGGRSRRAFPGETGPPVDAGRHAAHQRRGRRVQLRHARSRSTQSRL